MAMKALRCTQCGAELELDDSREFGFCSCCGTKIMLRETVEHHHTGTVRMEMDNSKQGQNRIALGDRAFSAGNYQEAYNYYTKALEDMPDHFCALYRKGICATFLGTDEDRRLSELLTGLEAAWDLMSDWLSEAEEDSPEQDNLYNLAAQHDADMEALANDALNRTQEYYYRLSDRQKCDHQASVWCETIYMLDIICGHIFNEEIKEALLAVSINRCDEWLGYDSQNKIVYYTNTTTNKNGKSTDHYSAYRMGDRTRQIMTKCRGHMAEKYNTLSIRLERQQSLNDSLSALEAEAQEHKARMDEAQAAYDQAKESFWGNNGELAVRRDKIKNLSWISVGVGLLIFLITLFAGGNAARGLGIVVLIASFFVRKSFLKSQMTKLENEVFSDDVKSLGQALEEAQHAWYEKENARRQKQQEVSAFEASRK